ncbi:MAG: NUDIX domain-containing protein [Candidatus Thorarchaeota archaeon]
MVQMIPIAITILKHEDKFLFLKRKNPPYENLWSMVGGKVSLGEHIRDAAIREVMEETGASDVTSYEFRGMVSERLIRPDGALSAHFLIFVNYAEISSYVENHREGSLSIFSESEISSLEPEFLPSDFQMFRCFSDSGGPILYEAELLHDDGYHLIYYRESEDGTR